MTFLIIEKTRIGYKIHTDEHPALHYIGYNARNAEKEYRLTNNLKYKHFTKIYI
jgi:hypothetical protein